jgi:hypothetical protein
MKYIKISIICLLISYSDLAIGQKVFQFLINDFSDYNPAHLSTSDNFQLNLKAYNSFLPENYFSGAYMKGSAPIKKTNSTLGFDFQYFEAGDLKDIKAGLAYSYQLKLTEQSTLAIGLKASLYSIQDKYYTLYINGTPYLEKEFKSNKLNLDAGLWLQKGLSGIGISFNHINSPVHHAGIQYESKENNPYAYYTEINLMADNKLLLTDRLNLNNSLFIYDIGKIDLKREMAMNNIFEVNKTFIFGTVWSFLNQEETIISLHSIVGFNLNNRYKILIAYKQNEIVLNKQRINQYEKRIRSDFEGTFLINF